MRIHALALLAGLGLCCAALAGDAEEPTYADKPATWWVEEFVAGDNQQAARAVLSGMGAGAAPAILARLRETRAARDRVRLLQLLGGMRGFAVEDVGVLRPSLESSDAGEVKAALELAADAFRNARSAGADAASLAPHVAVLLDARDARTRCSAAATLGRLGSAAAPYAAALAQLLDDDATAAAGAHALGEIGPAAAEAAAARLVAHIEARGMDACLLTALARVAPDDERTTNLLLRATDSTDATLDRGLLELATRSMPDGRALRAFVAALAADPAPERRAAAAQAYGRIGKAAGEFPTGLFALLGDADATVELRAIAAVRECGAAAQPHLERLATAWQAARNKMAWTHTMRELRPASDDVIVAAALSDDGELRGAAWHLLSRTRERSLSLDAERVSRLLFDERVAEVQRQNLLRLVIAQQLLADDVGTQVCAALATEGPARLASEAAAHLRIETARQALLAAVRRPEAEVRRAAWMPLLGAVPTDSDVRDAAVAALDDADEVIRGAVLGALAGAGDAWRTPSATRDALAARALALLSESRERAWDALRVVGLLPAEAWRPGTARALLARDDAAEAALSLVQERYAALAPELRTLCDDEVAVVAARAARVVLARAPEEALVERMGGWLESDDARVAREAAIAVAGLPPDTILRFGGALVRVLARDVQGVAWPACSALGRIADRAPTARAAVLAVADDPRHSCHAGVVGFLLDYGDEGFERLAALLRSPVRDARRNLCVCLGNSDPRLLAVRPDTLDALRELTRGDDLELAQLAQRALDVIAKLAEQHGR